MRASPCVFLALPILVSWFPNSFLLPERLPKRIDRSRSESMNWNVDSVVTELQKRGSKRGREGMARFAIRSRNLLGVSVAGIRKLAKRIGRNHALAVALWKTKIHEARILSAFIAEPARVTPALMDRWARDFDNWAVCDTLCFHLFDKTSHAWNKVDQWSDVCRSGLDREFVRRAAFALLASLALHDKNAPDAPFLERLPLIERAATDERNFVKKGVSWALRGIGHRNRVLNTAALNLARRLSTSENAAARWIGKDALRDMTRPAVLYRLDRRSEFRTPRSPR